MVGFLFIQDIYIYAPAQPKTYRSGAKGSL